MGMIEIRPSDKVLFITSFCMTNKDQEYLKDSPDFLKKLINRNLSDPFIKTIINKQVIEEIPRPESKCTEYRTTFYAFTPEEMKQFINEIQEKVLDFARKRDLR